MRIAIILLCILPVAAAAQSDPLSLKRAQAYVDLGTELFRKNLYADALIEFQRAAELEQKVGPLAVVRWNLARCYEELKKAPEAIVAFERFLETDAPEGQKKVAQEKLDVLLAQTFGAVELSCDPADAQFSLRGPTPVESKACPGKLDRLQPGTYSVRVVSQDGLDKEEEIEISAGSSTTVEITVPGALDLTANVNDAEVFVNGSSIGKTPIKGYRRRPGRYVVTTKSGEQAPWTADVVIEAGRTTQAKAKFALADEPVAPPPAETAENNGGGSFPSKRLLAWASAGGAVLSVAGGAFFYVSAKTSYDEAEAFHQDYDKLDDPNTLARTRKKVEDSLSDGQSSAILAYVFLGTGAALAGVSTWLFLQPDEPTGRTGPVVGAVPAVGGGLLFFSASF